MTQPVLEGKVALVTGGGRGLGRSMSLGLAGHGADVIVTSRKIEANREIVARIEAMGRRSLAIAADISKVEDIHRMVDECIAEFGGIDILVNNAGTSPINSLALDVEEWAWDKIFNTNLKGLFFCSQAVAKHMIDSGAGAIINIASVAGSGGSPFLCPYGASKAAVIQLTRTLALEWADYGIRVNAIGPATFEVGVSEPVLKVKELADDIIAKTPLKRIGKVEELIGALVYFASDASSYVTGQTLFIDGGWSA
ncbi:MAG: glucose 1-dehydrogenase [Deltaproteobacteria bacterium]|nr:glucose 1-dehydrogenase [Deltaproteobacteria bacterium]